MIRDPHSESARETAAQLASLAAQIELQTSYDKCIPFYMKIRDHLAITSGRIHQQQKNGKALPKKRLILDDLYKDTVQRMKALLQIVKEIDSEAKKYFAEYMNDWLEENWENPFPNEEGLAEIARVCGTSSIVVKNWLIKNRTHKWHPAVMKTREKGRPSDLRKADMINIFDGKPLRF